MRSAAATLSAMGFCSRIALPAAAASGASDSCVSSGVAMITACESRRSQRARRQSVGRLRDAEALRERVCTRRRTADDDAYVSPAGRGQAGEVVLGDESGTEHRHADGALCITPSTLKRPGTLTSAGSAAASGSVYV